MGQFVLPPVRVQGIFYPSPFRGAGTSLPIFNYFRVTFEYTITQNSILTLIRITNFAP